MSANPDRPAKERPRLSRVIFWISLVVFIVCVAALAVIGLSYWQGQNKYNEISELALDVDDVQAKSLADITVDWDSLLEINPDTVAWIYVPETSINYPVVQTDNNQKYLKTDFQGETNWIVSDGAVFLDAECDAKFGSQNSFLYGHNMNDGSMFHDLVNFANDDYFNEHRTIYLFTPQGNYRLTSFALLHVSASDALVEPDCGSAEQQAAYIQDKLNRSVVSPAGTLPATSEIAQTIELVTCDNLASNGRYVLYAYVAESTVSGVHGLEAATTLDSDLLQNVQSGVAGV